MWNQAAARCAAVLTVLALAGCPGPGARPGPANPYTGTPEPGRPPAAAEDPAVGITRVAAAVPGAGRVLTLVVGNAALIALQTNSPGAGGTAPPSAGLGGYDPSFHRGAFQRPVPSDAADGDTEAGRYGTRPYGPGGELPEAAPPGFGRAPEQTAGIPPQQVEQQVAQAVRQAFPFIVEVRFARDQRTAARMVPVVEAQRNGQSVGRFLPQLAELIDDMDPPAREPAGSP